MNDQDKIIIYCDGSCLGNQNSENSGGWGAILKYGSKVKEINGGERNTTNQKMELTACIKALEQVKNNNIDIEVYSDSAYLINCMHQKWYLRWKKNGWKNSHKQPLTHKNIWIK